MYDAFSANGDSLSVDCILPPEGIDAESPEYALTVNANPDCCTVGWDSFCNDLYNAYLNADENGGCALVPESVDTTSAAYAAVIAGDPFCCHNQWDVICQNSYDAILSGDSTDCVDVPASVDTESDAYAVVIAQDAFCCSTVWDAVCQNNYDQLNGGGDDDDPETPGNGCAPVPEGVDTESSEYTQVIEFDPFCCDFSWDGLCQSNYENLLADEPLIGLGNALSDWYFDIGDGSCAAVPAAVDTASEAYATVVANDPFCCNVAWDNICQNAYNNLTGNGTGSTEGEEPWQPVDEGACITPPDSVDADSEAYDFVIGNDPFCCNFGWDVLCQDAYDNFDGSEPENPEEGDCIEVPEGIDNESEAYAQTIAQDAFCCTSNWDQICDDLYSNFSNTSGIAAPPAAEGRAKFALEIYPNPAVNVLNANFIQIDNKEPVIVEIYSVTGQKVLQSQVFNAGRGREVIDVSALSSGFYLINARQGNETVTDRFMIQK